MAQPKVKFYFEGPEFWAKLDAQRAEYGDGVFQVLEDGNKGYVNITGLDGDGGDPINESTQCPGGLRC